MLHVCTTCTWQVSIHACMYMQGHLRHNWRTRWFVLDKQELRYYRNRDDRNPAGVINLAGATLSCPTLDEYKKPVSYIVTTYRPINNSLLYFSSYNYLLIIK